MSKSSKSFQILANNVNNVSFSKSLSREPPTRGSILDLPFHKKEKDADEGGDDADAGRA